MEMERVRTGIGDEPEAIALVVNLTLENDTYFIAPRLTCTSGYTSGLSSLSTPPLSANASESHALARTMAQKSTQ